MDCSEFKDKLGLYVDGELDRPTVPFAARHLLACTTCSAAVTAHQKARALLITAVAEEATAVDVSGLWREIESRLDPPPGVLSLTTARARRMFRGRVPSWAALTTAAAAAAVVFVVLMGSGQGSAPARIAAAGPRERAQSRPVRIDAMEVGAGRTVSTWMRPKTRTRIIWVANTANVNMMRVADHPR